eukprot:6373142-Prymnesium_polylepis.1
MQTIEGGVCEPERFGVYPKFRCVFALVVGSGLLIRLISTFTLACQQRVLPQFELHHVWLVPFAVLSSVKKRGQPDGTVTC